MYRRSTTSALLNCISLEDASYALRVVHEGICGDHSGGKTLALKILRQGYFWSTINKDAMEFVKKYHNCHIPTPILRQPPLELSSIMSFIPFAIWGIDLVSPFPIAKGQLKFCVVVIDYMTKWVGGCISTKKDSRGKCEEIFIGNCCSEIRDPKSTTLLQQRHSIHQKKV